MGQPVKKWKSAKRHVVTACLLGAGMTVFPLMAEAHLVNARFGDFYGGMLHLLFSLEHLLPMIALGLLTGLQDPRVGRWTLIVTPLGLWCGVLLAPAVPADLPLAWLTPAAFVVLGLLVAAGWQLTLVIMIAIAALAGVVQGYGNGLAMVDETATALFACGVALGGFALLALLSATVLCLRQTARWTITAVRTGGSWIAAVGLMVAVVT